MFYRSSIGALTLSVAICFVLAGAQALDEAKFPDWDGQWKRGTSVTGWDPAKPPARGQQPPLTPEYQAVWETTLAMQAAGKDFDPKAKCLPPGMPRVMMMYEPMEVTIKPNVTIFMMESVSPFRRIFTDGRDWPKEFESTYMGYSIGKWTDEDRDGRYDTLSVETRGLKGPRLFDGYGIPTHKDNQTIVRERLSLDKANPDILLNEVTTIDNALTRPWTVLRKYQRERKPIWTEFICAEDNRYVIIGGENYLLGIDGFLMPVQKGQPRPDLRYFDQAQR